MQQTQKYKLNLIESSDPFLPEGLNANTQKVEEVLAAHEAKVDGQVSALAAAMGSGGHTCRMAYGTFKGSGTYGPNSPNTLTFDFYPVFLIAVHDFKWGASIPKSYTFMVRSTKEGATIDRTNSEEFMSVTWTENGVKWYHTNADRTNSGTYYYLAIGYDKNADEE